MDGGDATVIVAMITAAGAAIVATVGGVFGLWQFFVKRGDEQKAKQALYTTEGYTISQKSLLDALAQANADRERDRAEAERDRAEAVQDRCRQRDEIVALRAEVEQMRVELRAALLHAAECDEQRLLQEERSLLQDEKIRILEDQLNGRQL